VGKHLKDHLYLTIPFAMELAIPLGELATAVGMTDDKTAFNEYLATGKGLPATSMYDASLFYDTGVDPATKHSHDGQISWISSALTPDFYTNNNGIEGFMENYDVATMFDMEKGCGIIFPQVALSVV
jgi:hypothetical protein